MKSFCLLARWVIAVSFLSFASVNAGVFIKIGDIKGESQAPAHEEEIDVLSWSWGVSRPVMGGETGSDRTRGAPKFIDLEINKVLGKATPKLFEACVTGFTIPEAILVIEREVESGVFLRLFEIKMTNVSITSDTLTGSAEAIENVTLSFEEVEMTYADGSPEGIVKMSYNILANE